MSGVMGTTGAGRLRTMHARSALFDVYGDHLRTRGHRAAVADLVRLLAPIGIAAPAVRTAISRMVSQGWLEPATVGGARGYAATPQAIRRLEQTAERIYRRRDDQWDGCWQLLLLDPFPTRAVRTAVLRDLPFLGYAALDDRVWVSPWIRDELTETLARAGAGATTARAHDFDPPGSPARAWDLEAIGAEYAAWLDDAAASLEAHLAAHADPDEAAFAARFHLVHEWRKFLFTDPGLPGELLPADWPGRRAADYFRREADRLAAASERFAARTLTSA
jgi:phenylacetic acid degradation operon negative regulatory protein